jgi:hypothetical protein
MEKIDFDNEKPKELNKFTYINHSKNDEVLFECVAKSILDADKMYQEKTGQNPERQNFVGCFIEKINKDDK